MLDWNRKRIPQANETQIVKLMTTNSVISILVGRLKDTLIISQTFCLFSSDLAYALRPCFRSFFARLARITSPRVSLRMNQKRGRQPASKISWVQKIHLQERFRCMAPPMNGPRAIPTTEVMPKMDIGTLRSFTPFQMSVIVPPTMLILTEEAPPPKNRVTVIHARPIC